MAQEVIAQLRHLRIAPRKTRFIADVIRGLSVNEAEARLVLSPRRPSADLLKLVRSASANAKSNFKLDPEKLYIKEIRVDQGPMSKRLMPRAQGRGAMIQKRTSHVTLILETKDTLQKPRFTFKEHKKEKKAHKDHAQKEKPRKESHEEPRKEIKASPKGFLQKMFRRKAI